MTVSNTSSRIAYVGDGTTTGFAFPYEFGANSDLKVYKAGTLQTITTHYTVSGGGGSSGTVTFVTAPAASESVVIYDDPPSTQLLDYIANDTFPAESHESGLDKITRGWRRLKDLLSRTVRLADTDVSGASTVLPTPSAQKVLGWNAAANALVNYSTSDLTTIAAFAAWQSQTFSGDNATTAFVLTSDPGNIANLDVAISGVTQYPTIDFTLSGTTLTFLVAPPTGTDNILARWGQALPQSITEASAVNFLQAGAGAVTRTVQDRMRESVSSSDFTSIQAAIDFAGANGKGAVLVPPGEFDTTAEIVVDYEDLWIIGSGSSYQNITEDGVTLIRGGHTSGAVFRFKKAGCGLFNLVVSADATRQAEAYTGNGHGVRFEAEDAAGTPSMKRSRMSNVRITKQPASGLVLIGDVLSSNFEFVDVDQCGGHGIVVSGGEYTARANLDRPGQLKLDNCRTSRCGGQGLRIGHTSDDPLSRPYRIGVTNHESFYNGRTAGAKTVDFDWMVHGENIDFEQSAVSGETDAATPGHGGIYIAGKNIKVKSQRFVDCDVTAAEVADYGGSFVTEGVQIEVDYINNDNAGAGHYNPAVLIAATALDTKVTSSTTSGDVTLLAEVDGENTVIEHGDTHRYFGTQVTGAFKSVAQSASLSDDNAGYYTFSGSGEGIAVIAGNIAGAGSAVVFFRVGDASANVTVLSSGGVTVDGAAEALSATVVDGYGTDTRLTIVAVQDNPRLYLSNRTGGNRSYKITILSSVVAIEPGGINQV